MALLVEGRYYSAKKECDQIEAMTGFRDHIDTRSEKMVQFWRGVIPSPQDAPELRSVSLRPPPWRPPSDMLTPRVNLTDP